MATNLVVSRLKVAVIGACTIGLCTDAALKQQGHNVKVFERRRDTEPRGHALVIQPGAVRALGHLRAHEAFEQVSVESGPLCLWSYKGNSIVRTPQPPPEEGITQYEKRFQTDRPSVQRVFETRCRQRSGVGDAFWSRHTQVRRFLRKGNSHHSRWTDPRR